jgi:two-component system cell cycle sensor histidine kinase/response regulator CckA
MERRLPVVLVVDDEEQIGFLASLFLQRAGYRTIKATSVTQALEKWTPEVKLLLTDCAMPDSPGDQLALRLLERDPCLKVLFMSGNAVESLVSKVPLVQGINFIQKPFTSEELLAFIETAVVSEGTVLN